jgi:diamine N-acetyltransferase
MQSQIRIATQQDIATIQTIANKTWPITYGSIISNEQLQYMLQLFYNTQELEQQLANPANLFLLLQVQDEFIGYAQAIKNTPNINSIKISKLYILPTHHGKSHGATILNYIEQWAREQSFAQVVLNVNIHNPAYYFYLKNGYTVQQQIDIPLDKYWLNDYIMIKTL